MPYKDPSNWSLVTWLLVTVMSIFGGISSWYKRAKDGHPRAINFVELMGEIATSGLMGFVGFAVADWYFDNVSLSAAAAGMCAHFATRLLYQAEGLIDLAGKKVAKRLK